jgi:glycosyltransferase involved in cell wall biosynthesis
MKSAFLLSAPYDQAKIDQARAGQLPRPDYILLTEALGADLLTPVAANVVPKGKTRNFLRRARVAWHGFRRRKQYDLIISDLENVGLILALLLKLSRSKTRHVMICHAKVVNPWAIRFNKLFGLNKVIDSYICYGPRVTDLLLERLPATQGKVTTIYHPADHRFWKPTGEQTERLITIAGMLGRDFDTFIEAVKGIDVQVYIAGFSPWMTARSQPLSENKLPENIKFGRLSPSDLRDKFNKSLFVALPLFQSNGQDGSLVMYESMACGKAVAVSKTNGQMSMQIVEEGGNGFCLDIGDVRGWREVIQRFLDDPELAARMGRRSREIVEQRLNLERWTAEFAENVRGVLAKPRE